MAAATVDQAWEYVCHPVTRRLRQEDSEFEASLGSIVRSLQPAIPPNNQKGWVLGTTSVETQSVGRGQAACHGFSSGCLGTSVGCCKGQDGEGLGR